VLRLIGNLLPLTGAETGPGEVVWWDASTRWVADRALLAAVVRGLLQGAGHQPDLTGHPLATWLAGGGGGPVDAGLCTRLPVLRDAARRQGVPLPEASLDPSAPPAVYLLSQERSLAAGEVLAGSGLLVVQAPLTVVASAVLRWQGMVLLDGGRIAGPGVVQVDGGVTTLGGDPAAAPAVDLMGTRWQVGAAPAVAAQAWEGAGIVLLSRWEGFPGE
jgi:hypothetical protein